MKIQKVIVTILLTIGTSTLVACGNTKSSTAKSGIDHQTTIVSKDNQKEENQQEAFEPNAENETTDSNQMKLTEDGTAISKSDDGSTILTYADGTVLSLAQDDSYILSYMNGTKVTKAKEGSRLVNLANGTQITVQPDSSFVITESSGSSIKGNATDIQKVNDLLATVGYKDGLKTFDILIESAKKLVEKK